MKDLMHFHLPDELKIDYNSDLMIVSNELKEAAFKAPATLERTYVIDQLLDKKCCCSVCQGILQVTDNDTFVDNICKHVKDEGFEFESFKFNVHAPLSSTFR